MLIKRTELIRPSEITAESSYLNRRAFIKASGVAMSALPLAACGDGSDARPSKGTSASTTSASGVASSASQKLSFRKASAELESQGFYTGEELTPEADVRNYSNFYEFGTGKDDPARYASTMKTAPWAITVDGEVAKPGRYFLEDVIDYNALEERIYRFRCVEAWSMVIPWLGIPLAKILQQFEPTSKAKYVAFETLYRPEEMRGQRSAFATIDWPYREGLRIDEAMHPLSLMVVGLYGKTLPNENGAPLRLMLPWKYGFKSIKSIVRISFTEQQPQTSWNMLAPKEYGFFSNVNPEVDHPRWSQSSERRLPSTLFAQNRIKTLPFNGYAEQVSSLYSGMNLRKYF